MVPLHHPAPLRPPSSSSTHHNHPHAELLQNSQDGISIAPNPTIITLTRRHRHGNRSHCSCLSLCPYIIMRNTATENSEALFVKINNTTSHPARSAAHYSAGAALTGCHSATQSFLCATVSANGFVFICKPDDVTKKKKF